MILILRGLGQEQFRLVDGKMVPTGIYVSKDGSYFWRCNSGERIYSYTTKEGRRKKGKFKAAPAGTADILGVILGVSIAIEVKRPGEKPSDVQQWWAEIHERAGGVRVWVESFEQAKREVKRIREAIHAGTIPMHMH
jgi:hypothetical protein